MNAHTQAWLVDEAVDAYVDWREECATVRDAYERWRRAAAVGAGSAFAAYRAAVDREERAADIYAEVMGRLAAACPLRSPTGANAAVADPNSPGSST
jgi:hypothetical protein